MAAPARLFRHRGGALALGRPVPVMGIVNVTPDSFSDGGLNAAPDAAIAAALRMVEAGAGVLDIGGESTRPGHVPMPADAEWARLAPVLAGLAAHATPPISVDTWKAEVARRALDAGAAIVNDVWGFRRDPAMAGVVAETGAGAILMHNRDAIDPDIDIVDDILRELERSVALAERAGIPPDAIMLDPGIGFGKTYRQNRQAIAALPRLKALGFPVLLGLSRKAFIGALSDPPLPASERLGGTIAANVLGVLNGADMIRVHDVPEHVQAMRLLASMDPVA